MARDARDPAAWMTGGSTLVQSMNGSAVIGEVSSRALEKQLVEREFPMKDMPVGHVQHFFHIGRRECLHANNSLRKTGSYGIDRASHGLDEIFALLSPDSVFQGVRCMATIQVNDVLPCGSHAVIENGRRCYSYVGFG